MLSIERYLPGALAVFYVTVIAHYCISPLVETLWRTHDPLGEAQRAGAKVQGNVERLLYLGAFATGQEKFIAAWLALKVASRWWAWQERPGFNVFLAGTGLSILFAAAGHKIASWTVYNPPGYAIILPCSLVAASLILRRWPSRLDLVAEKARADALRQQEEEARPPPTPDEF